MGFSFDISVPVLTVFAQGLLSFLSPCVLPLLPLYLSYLAGGGKHVGEDGRVYYPRRQVFSNTLFFTCLLYTSFSSVITAPYLIEKLVSGKCHILIPAEKHKQIIFHRL